ncbi:MAG: DNA-protecting protein DprA [Nocardioidaceae bacterium]|nr:DNA-protecting protein DprA [Nocardioidaceae bacterium]
MSAPEHERLARAALSMIVEPGDLRFLDDVAANGPIGSIERVAGRPEANPDALPDAQSRMDRADPAAELERVAALGIRFVVPGDEEWPAQLGDLAGVEAVQERGGVPIGLWVAGPLRLCDLEASVAVVGSRDSTLYGEQVASDITAGLGLAGHATVSGAAIGIDYAAHRGAIAVDAPTVAVLACGADRDYPPRHADLLRHLRDEGAVVSEVPLGGAPHRIRFLARNRIIAALTRGTVVVEAAARSGALNTLNWSQRLNRMPMGVPGPVTSVASLGVHHHLRSGGASLVTSAADVLELVGRIGEHLTEIPRGEERPRDRLSVRDQQILDAVPVYQGADPASIARVAGAGLTSVEEALASLAEAGLVERDGAGWRLTEPARA